MNDIRSHVLAFEHISFRMRKPVEIRRNSTRIEAWINLPNNRWAFSMSTFVRMQKFIHFSENRQITQFRGKSNPLGIIYNYCQRIFFNYSDRLIHRSVRDYEFRLVFTSHWHETLFSFESIADWAAFQLPAPCNMPWESREPISSD